MGQADLDEIRRIAAERYGARPGANAVEQTVAALQADLQRAADDPAPVEGDDPLPDVSTAELFAEVAALYAALPAAARGRVLPGGRGGSGRKRAKRPKQYGKGKKRRR
jgi:hypothetical protein